MLVLERFWPGADFDGNVLQHQYGVGEAGGNGYGDDERSICRSECQEKSEAGIASDDQHGEADAEQNRDADKHQPSEQR